jgi:hypothetical protein
VSGPASETELEARFGPALDDLVERSRVAERFVDKDIYRILVATVWTNVVLDPADAGIEAEDLEALHDLINRRLASVLGRGEDLKACFRYLTSKAGDRAMQAARLTQNHKDLLLYLASVILDPAGHKRWMAEITDRSSR